MDQEKSNSSTISIEQPNNHGQTSTTLPVDNLSTTKCRSSLILGPYTFFLTLKPNPSQTDHPTYIPKTSQGQPPPQPSKLSEPQPCRDHLRLSAGSSLLRPETVPTEVAASVLYKSKKRSLCQNSSLKVGGWISKIKIN